MNLRGFFFLVYMRFFFVLIFFVVKIIFYRSMRLNDGLAFQVLIFKFFL